MPQLYLCPQDTNHYVRTYSINGHLEGEKSPVADTLAQVRHASTTVVGIEEYDSRGYNENSFYIDDYPSDNWVDIPLPYHQRAGMVSFAGGHAQVWVWNDRRTSDLRSNNTSQTGNKDLMQLQAWIGNGGAQSRLGLHRERSVLLFSTTRHSSLSGFGGGWPAPWAASSRRCIAFRVASASRHTGSSSGKCRCCIRDSSAFR